MELIATVVFAFPLGYLLRNRAAAYVSYIAIHQFVFNFQNLTLVREWVGGSDEAFSRNPKVISWSYGLVNLVIYVVGFGLVTLGYGLAARRRRKGAGASRRPGPRGCDG